MARSFEQLLLYHWLPKLYKTQTLMHEDIAWGHMNLPRDERTINCVCCGGWKYRQCDVRWPCLVVDGNISITPFQVLSTGNTSASN